MKKFNTIAIAVLMLLLLTAASAVAQQGVVPIPKPTNDLEIRVWTNKADGKSFGQGEHIIVYFQANRDCYVTIYDLDTDGDINLLFPLEYNDPCYVEGGRLYTIPDYYDDFELVVQGPPGDEYIQAVASLDPFDVPAWPSKFYKYDEYYPLHEDRDAVDFLNYVNHRYFPLDNCSARCSVDQTHFEVRRNWDYDWDDYYGTRPNYYDNYYYDPWGWCGTVYIGYPYGAAIYIDGWFYGYAPLFIPRIYVGWHRFGIWWDDCWWYNDRFHVYAGGWYNYGYDDVRYKGDRHHYGFKPGRRGSSDDVAAHYQPNRHKTVYTKNEGYISKDRYHAERTKTPVRSDNNKYFKGVTKGERGTGSQIKVDNRVSVKSKTGKDNDYKNNSGWKDYNSLKGSGVKKEYNDNSGKSIRSTGADSKKTKREYTTPDNSSDKKSVSGRSKSASGERQPIFRPKSSGEKKSSGGQKGSNRTKISTNGSRTKSSGGSSGYSRPSGGRTAPSGGQKSSGGSRSGGSGGAKKGGRR